MSAKALDLIKNFEGCRLTAYDDGFGIFTIGYGHTGPGVVKGLTITQEQADDLLAGDVRSANATLNRLVAVPLTDNQRAALISFVFNVGSQAFKTSTLLRLLNSGDYTAAAAQFERWNKAGGVEVRGLTRRRLAEAALFQAT